MGAAEAAAPIEVTVRLATRDDLRAILGLLGQMHLEVGIGTLDPHKTTASVAQVIDNGIPLLALKGDTPIGTMGLEEVAWWYSRDTYLGDRWNFVLREHRASKAAAMLRDTAKGIARKSSLPLLLASLGGEDHDRKRLFFRRGGLKEIGATFMMEA